MKYQFISVALGSLLAATIARADTHAVVVTPSNAAEQSVLAFLDGLKAGKTETSLKTLLGTSPLWASKTELREALISQIDTAARIYGPISSYELVDRTDLGHSATREYFIVYHRDMVTRWEFELINTGSGWKLGYLGFEDQIRTWF